MTIGDDDTENIDNDKAPVESRVSTRIDARNKWDRYDAHLTRVSRGYDARF